MSIDTSAKLVELNFIGYDMVEVVRNVRLVEICKQWFRYSHQNLLILLVIRIESPLKNIYLIKFKNHVKLFALSRISESKFVEIL